MNIKWCNYWGKSSFVCLAISEILRCPLAPSMISWYRSPDLGSLSLSWDLWIPDKLSRICSWWWCVMMLAPSQAWSPWEFNLVFLDSRIHGLLWLTSHKNSSWITPWSGQEEHLSMSEPLIRLWHKNLSPWHLDSFITIVRHVSFHFLEPIASGQPGDASWPPSLQLPVSRLTPGSRGLVFVVWVFLVIGVRIEELRMDTDRWAIWSLHRQPAYHQSPKHYHCHNVSCWNCCSSSASSANLKLIKA